MACSFYEGYLVHILPNDGAQFGGFEKNIERYEAVHKVTFPVKKLFLIITKKLYCPPDLADFNKNDKNLPYLEACSSLEDVEKDVAGVKNRKYRNSIYKIYQKGADPVYIAAECATPLHTLQKVKERRAEYKDTTLLNARPVCTRAVPDDRAPSGVPGHVTNSNFTPRSGCAMFHIFFFIKFI
ncbi:Stimulator of interferon genes protein [Eumeta japonica]|uniref:Stimulator of interferon genes protein n=1 Tax=Eumeta variegata TaxID=151549 RepID=A0A4C1TVE9_EUMVA|nr:Stimulator of interferon genes protein [Eumeta japonica]